MSVEQTISQIMDSVFPAHAEIHINEQIESFQAGISWNLNNDPERPNKKSKTIILNISREVLEDLPNVPPAKQEECFEKISSYLQQRLSDFDPEHSAPYGQPAPAETWVINTIIAGLTSS